MGAAMYEKIIIKGVLMTTLYVNLADRKIKKM